MTTHTKKVSIRPLDFCLETPYYQNAIGELRDDEGEKKFEVMIDEEDGKIIDLHIDGLELPDVRKSYFLSTCIRHDIFCNKRGGFDIKGLVYIAIKQCMRDELFIHFVYRDPLLFNSY